MKEIEFDVTAEDIFRGKKGFAFTCPVSFAAARFFGKSNEDCGVSQEDLIVFAENYNDNVKYLFSQETTEMIKKYDCGQGMVPFKAKATKEE